MTAFFTMATALPRGDAILDIPLRISGWPDQEQKITPQLFDCCCDNGTFNFAATD